MPHAGLRVSRSTTCSRRSRRTRASSSSPTRTTRPASAMPLEAIRDDRAARAAGRGRLRRRGLRRVRRRQLHPRARRVSERRRRPHVLEGVRPRRPAHRLPGRRAGRRSIRSAAPCRSTASTSPRSPPCRRRSTISITCNGYLRQVAESKALLYAACDRLGLDVLEERVELRARARRRSHRRARRRRVRARRSTSATARPSRAAPAASASTTGIVEHTQRAASRCWRRSCAPRGNRSARRPRRRSR